MKKIYLSLICIFLGFTAIQAQSNLFIDDSFTPEQMVMDFFDNSCVTPSNITFNGAPVSIAYFEAGDTDIGVNAGIVITSGDVAQLAQAASNFATTFNDTDGDADLNDLVGGNMTSDAAVLEFDITVLDGGDLNFQYVFGSEEYPEYVGSAFNDVFGFLVTGPGTPGVVNIALVPGSNTPVAINNVNAGINANYYVPYADNGGEHVVFDGLTTELEANFQTVNLETYHVKIAVTDVSDGIFDSGVFIGVESLCGGEFLTPPAQGLATVDGNTATFVNESRYATSWHWNFGDNTTSDERHPAPHTYAEDGVYEVTITTENYCCSDTYTFEVEIGDVNNVDEIGAKPFEIFPNPVADYLQLKNTNGGTFDYELFHTNGQMLQAGQLTGDQTLDLSELNAGLYLFILKNETGSFVEKVMIR